MRGKKVTTPDPPDHATHPSREEGSPEQEACLPLDHIPLTAVTSCLNTAEPALWELTPLTSLCPVGRSEHATDIRPQSGLAALGAQTPWLLHMTPVATAG